MPVGLPLLAFLITHIQSPSIVIVVHINVHLMAAFSPNALQSIPWQQGQPPP